MQVLARNSKPLCNALPCIEQVADHRHRMIANPLEQLGGSALSQREHGRKLKTGIDRPRDPMQLPACFERSQQAAHALIAHGSRFLGSGSLTAPIIAAAAGNG
jgi:hypothetical protein